MVLATFVVTLPMIQSLKNKYPKAKITLVGSFRSKKLIPYIDSIDNFFIIPKGNKYIQTLKFVFHYANKSLIWLFLQEELLKKLMNLVLWLTGTKKRIAYTDNHWNSILINNPRLYKRNKNQHNALSILKITSPKFKETPNNIYLRINTKQNSITNFKNKIDLILDSNCFNLNQ